MLPLAEAQAVQVVHDERWPEYCLFILAWFPPRLVTPGPELAA
jgi:hypothetical protein